MSDRQRFLRLATGGVYNLRQLVEQLRPVWDTAELSKKLRDLPEGTRIFDKATQEEIVVVGEEVLIV